MNQEKLMKKRMWTAIIMLIITLIALLVFIGLYIDEKERVQKTYRSQYRTELRHVSGEIEGYLNTEGGYDTRYSMIIGYMSSASSYAFLINDFEDKQKIVNELNTCLIKYPEQMSERLPDVKKAIDDILDDLDKGYEEAEAIVSEINKKGN